jgi:superfamily II DNA or RNA helicase
MNAPFKLRPYQQDAVEATLNHFRKSDESAVFSAGLKRKERHHC